MKRQAQLDGVRGVAILLVLIWHYVPCQIGPLAEPQSTLGHWTQLLGQTWSGVDLFFVLSGFLIVGILLDHREAPNYFRVFYTRRLGRIFPLYVLLVSAYVVVLSSQVVRNPSFKWLFANPMPFWSYLTFTQNFLMGSRGDFGANWFADTWSLAVEEHFYVLLPLLVYLLRRRTLFYLFVASSLVAVLLRCGLPGWHNYVYTPWRADSLLMGACLACVIRQPGFAAAAERHRAFLWMLLALMLSGVGVMVLVVGSFGGFNHTWFAATYGTFILLALVDSERWLGSLLKRPLLVWLGTISYGTYIFHQVVSGLVHGAIRGKPPTIQTWEDASVTGLALGITLAAATLSYYVFERPIVRYAHRLQYGTRSEPDDGTAPGSIVRARALTLL